MKTIEGDRSTGKTFAIPGPFESRQLNSAHCELRLSGPCMYPCPVKINERGGNREGRGHVVSSHRCILLRIGKNQVQASFARSRGAQKMESSTMSRNRIWCGLRFSGKAFRGLVWSAAAGIAFLMAAGASGANAQAPSTAPAAAPSAPPAAAPAPPAQATTPAATPSEAPASPTDIAGIWQGTLHIAQANRDLRTEIKIAKDADGSYKLTFYSIDQGGQPFVADKTTFENGKLAFSMDAIGGKYEGKMSADGKTIDGTLTQGPNPLALNLERTTEDAAWPIPEPIKPMAPDAHPKLDVATIKPSKPGAPGKGIRIQRHAYENLQHQRE